MRIRIECDFHNVYTNAILKPGSDSLSPAVSRRIERDICPHGGDDCTCSRVWKILDDKCNYLPWEWQRNKGGRSFIQLEDWK